jgi:hypothetical protein
MTTLLLADAPLAFGGLALLAMFAAAVLLLYIAIMWVLLPHMLCRRLDNIIKLLGKQQP